MLKPLVASLVLCASLAACGEDSDTPEPAPAVRATTTPTDRVPAPPPELVTLEGGAVTVRVGAGPARIIDYAGVRLSTTGKARGRGRELTFPITDGRLAIAPATGRIELGGGLRVTARGDHVDATDLQLDPAQEVVTAIVEGRRVPLLRFRLRYPRTLPATGEPIIARGTTSLVGDRALERLGADFGVDLLREGLPLGSLQLIATATDR